MSDVMSVRLHLRGVRVLGVGVDSVDRLEVGSGIGPGVVEVSPLRVPLRQSVGPESEAGFVILG